MLQKKLYCDLCHGEIGQIPDDEYECSLYGDGSIAFSNYPNHIVMKLIGHGKLAQIDRTYHICESCLTDFTIHVNREKYFRKLVLKRVDVEEENK